MTRDTRYGTDLQVLIVGGGIAGLTLAGLLEQRGFSPDVVEQADGYGGMGGFIPDVLDEMETTDPEEMWHDDFYDLRMDDWTKGRVVLVGDAAHAPLPTAGVGASMAMESAAVLADELTRTDSTYLHQALGHYEARRHDRVDTAQDKSRQLGTVALFNHGSLLGALRDQAVKYYSRERMENYYRDFLSTEI